MSTIRERSLRYEQAMKSRYHDDPVTNLIDFLADAMHWCRCNATEFQQALDIAQAHFQAETNEAIGAFHDEH